MDALLQRKQVKPRIILNDIKGNFKVNNTLKTTRHFAKKLINYNITAVSDFSP